MSERPPQNPTEHPEKWKKVISPAIETKFPYAFRLEDGSAYVSVHFDKGIFARPGTGETVDVEEFIAQIKKELGVEKILLSCCYPDSARKFIQNIPGVTLVGSGNCPTRTLYSGGNRKEITVENVPPRENGE